MSDLPVAPPVPPPSPADRLPDAPSAAIRGLGGLIAVLLGLIAALNVVLLGVHWWGNHGFLSEVLQGSSSSYDDARWYDSIRRTLGIVGAVVTGVVWCVWQVKIARATPDDAIRRTPGWHAGSWFIPIGNLWMPFQNMHDLWSYWLHRAGSGLLRVWWGFWLVGVVLSRVMATKNVQSADIESFRSFNRLAIGVCGVEVVSSVLAIIVVSRLTQAVFSENK